MTPVAQARPYGNDSLCAKQVLLIEFQQTPAKPLEGVEFGLVQTESKYTQARPRSGFEMSICHTYTIAHKRLEGH
jgi:hypothetical protein